MNAVANRQAADRLHAPPAAGRPCSPIRDLTDAGDVSSAYAIKAHNVARMLAAGDRIVGHMIGLTAKSVQRQLGVEQPDFGALTADMAIENGEDVACHQVIQPNVEAEVALVLDPDITTLSPVITDVIRATAYATAAIEIVDSRISGWDVCRAHSGR